MGGWQWGGFIDQDTRISKGSVVAGPPPRRNGFRYKAPHTQTLLRCSHFFSLSRPLLLFLPSSVLLAILLVPFFSLAPSVPLLRAKYLATAPAKTRREPRRRCHILCERSWIQLHEVSETRHGSAEMRVLPTVCKNILGIYLSLSLKLFNIAQQSC